MIYLDNAATTYPKPPSVQNAVASALHRFGANPGRGGHAMSMATAEEVYRTRCAVSDFFSCSGTGVRRFYHELYARAECGA